VTEPESIGRRIAEQRKLRGWTQRELARRTGYSFSAVEKIERGLRSVDRYSTINAFASALGVDPIELTGENRRSNRHFEHAAIPPIRRVLMSLPMDVTDGPVRPISELDRQVNDAIKAREAGRYLAFGTGLPSLLDELHRLVHSQSGAKLEQAHGMLAEALHSGSVLLRRLGYVDLAWIAVQQARASAQLSSNPLMLIANDWNAIELYLRAGDSTHAAQLTDRALGDLERLMAHNESPQLISLLGTMHLLRSITAAQKVEDIEVRESLSAAQSLSARLGRDRDDFQTQFGPSNTAVFEEVIRKRLS
jgi:transcriptional regulator with XRE-family HTH domain